MNRNIEKSRYGINLARALFSVFLLLICTLMAGCSGFWQNEFLKTNFKGLIKTDLNAFLDGEGNEKEVIEEEVLEEVPFVIETESPVERCSAESDHKFSYRRRIGLLAFSIDNRRESYDFPQLERQYPELLSTYIDVDRFAVSSATHLRLLGEEDGRVGAWVDPTRQQIMQLAEELGVQFIVTGGVIDMSVNDPEVGALRLMMDPVVRKKIMGKVKRNFGISLSIFDGGTGVLIKRQNFAGDVFVDTSTLSYKKSFNQNFFGTQYGKLITSMLQQQGDFLLAALDCIPMQALVIAVDDVGVTIDAGIDSLILSGDKLQVFRRKKIRWQDNSPDNFRLERYGELTISSSSRLSAQGIFQTKDMLSGVSPGDIVQAW